MSKRNNKQILITVPNGVHVKIVRKKRQMQRNMVKTAKPYYLERPMMGENGEPLVERDYEG